MHLIRLSEHELRELRGILRQNIDAAYEEVMNTSRYMDPEDRAYTWEHTALLAGILASLARAEEVADAVS